MNVCGQFLYNILLHVERTLLRKMKTNFSDHKIGTKGINTPLYTNVIDFHIVGIITRYIYIYIYICVCVCIYIYIYIYAGNFINQVISPISPFILRSYCFSHLIIFHLIQINFEFSLWK